MSAKKNKLHRVIIGRVKRWCVSVACAGTGADTRGTRDPSNPINLKKKKIKKTNEITTNNNNIIIELNFNKTIKKLARQKHSTLIRFHPLIFISIATIKKKKKRIILQKPLSTRDVDKHKKISSYSFFFSAVCYEKKKM